MSDWFSIAREIIAPPLAKPERVRFTDLAREIQSTETDELEELLSALEYERKVGL